MLFLWLQVQFGSMQSPPHPPQSVILNQPPGQHMHHLQQQQYYIDQTCNPHHILANIPPQQSHVQAATTTTASNHSTGPLASPTQTDVSTKHSGKSTTPSKRKPVTKRRKAPLVYANPLSSKLLDETIESVARGNTSTMVTEAKITQDNLEEVSSTKSSPTFLENPTAFMAEQTAIVNSKLPGTSPTHNGCEDEERNQLILESSFNSSHSSCSSSSTRNSSKDKKDSEIIRLLSAPNKKGGNGNASSAGSGGTSGNFVTNAVKNSGSEIPSSINSTVVSGAEGLTVPVSVKTENQTNAIKTETGDEDVHESEAVGVKVEVKEGETCSVGAAAKVNINTSFQ